MNFIIEFILSFSIFLQIILNYYKKKKTSFFELGTFNLKFSFILLDITEFYYSSNNKKS